MGSLGQSTTNLKPQTTSHPTSHKASLHDDAPSLKETQALYLNIPGERLNNNSCIFGYTSDPDSTSGYTNSPNFPSPYPSNTTCYYIFLPQNDEKVIISFSHLQLRPSEHDRDYIAISEDERDNKHGSGLELQLKIFLQNDFIPGPYISSNPLYLEFHSAESVNNNIASPGFKLSFTFVKRHELDSRECPSNLEEGGGVVHSVNYPELYPRMSHCEWSVAASQPGRQLMLQIADLDMEGSLVEQGSRSTNCQDAVLRVYTDKEESLPIDLCGKHPHSLIGQSIISTNGFLRVSFTASGSAVGKKGFKVSWTEIESTSSSSGSCSGFVCEKSGYCIHSRLKCNSEPNCGAGDTSDEPTDCPVISDHLLVMIACVAGGVLIIMSLVMYGVYRLKNHVDMKSAQYDSCKTNDVTYNEDSRDSL